MEMTPAQRAEFDQKMAQQSAPQMTAAQKAEFDEKMAGGTGSGASQGPSVGEQLSDVGQRVGSANRSASEFTADVSRLPLTYAQRVRNASAGAEKGKGVVDTVTGYLGGLFGETEYDKEMNKALFGGDDLYQEEIGEGEGDWWLDPVKTAAGITTELAGSGWMGGGLGKQSGQTLAKVPFLQSSGKSAEMVAKSTPSSIVLGTAGQETMGDMGEAGGVIAGALAGDPLATTKLIATIFNPATYKKLAGKGIDKLLGKGINLETASPRQINAGLNAYVRQVYPGLPEEEIAEYVAQLSPRVEAAIKQGRKGTVGQLTEDAGLLEFEGAMTDPQGKGVTRENQATLARINADIAEEANAPMAAIEGVTQKAADAPAGLVRTRAAQADTAQSAVDEAAVPFANAPTTPQASVKLKQTMQAESDASKQVMQDAWAEMPEGSVDAADLQGSLGTFYDGLGQTGSKIFKKTFGDLTSLIEGLEGPVSVDDVSDILSMFSAKIHGADGVALKPERIQGFKDAIFDALDRGTEGASDARTAAAAASRDFFNKFGKDTRLGKALEGKAGEEFASSYLSGGDAGVARRNELVDLGGDQAVADIDEFVTADLANKVDGAGTLKDSSVNKYRDQLTPDTRARVDTLRGANRVRDDAATAAKDIEGSTVGKFAQGEGDVEVILDRARKVMNTTGPNRTKELKTLVDSVGTGPARDNLRRSFMDEFVNSVSDKKGLTQKGLEKFKDRRQVYQDAGLFSKEELDRVQAGLEEGQKLFLHEGDKIARLPPESRRILETVSAIAGAKAGATLFGSPLIGASIGKKGAKEITEQMTSKQARQLAFELATNPEKFVEQTNKLKGSNAGAEFTNKVWKEMLDIATGGAQDSAVSIMKGVPSKVPAAVSADRDINDAQR
jgi:hypothetical protein